MRLDAIRKLVCVTVLAAVLSAGTAFAEVSPAGYDSFKNALGFFGGTISVTSGAYGLQYQRWFDGGIGVQFTGGGSYNPSVSYPAMDYSANTTLLWSVYGQDFSRWLGGRLYLWAMAGHHGRFDYNYSLPKGDSPPVAEFVPTAFAGVGIGIETILFEHFSIPLQFGYSGEFPFKPSIGFSFGGGLRYRY
jgi:hypothetical protein